MMTRAGHEVILYGGPANDAECAEFVPCISYREQAFLGFAGPADYLKIDFNATEPWTSFNHRVIGALRERLRPRELICVITGDPTAILAETFSPAHIVVEIGVGYSGIYHRFRVFESYAWRNYVYGWKHIEDGQFFDEVIPNYYNVEDFPLSDKVGDYYLYLGRLIDRKGLRIAQGVCEKLGVPLKVAGPGEFSGYGEYVGVVNTEQRAELLSRAIALFAPTIYVPPFEGVHVEANLCGVPAITTDFGVFSETVENRDNGMRCTMEREFLAAAIWAASVDVADRWDIRRQAQRRYSTEEIAPQYETYFDRLLTLYDDGWYAK